MSLFELVKYDRIINTHACKLRRNQPEGRDTHTEWLQNRIRAIALHNVISNIYGMCLCLTGFCSMFAQFMETGCGAGSGPENVCIFVVVVDRISFPSSYVAQNWMLTLVMTQTTPNTIENIEVGRWMIAFKHNYSAHVGNKSDMEK